MAFRKLFVVVVFLIGLLATAASGLGNDDLFVDKSKQETQARLTRKDFRRALTIRRNHEQPLDEKRTLRRDLLEGDIKGLTARTVDDFIRASNRQYDSMGDPGLVQHSAIRNSYNLWPNKEIPYVISSQYSSRSRSLLAKVIQDFQSRTCLKFVPRTAAHRDYIYIRPDDGCYSHVGRTGGQQTVSLDGGCFQHGTMIHEIMHSTGFFHEQNRNDRDSYVRVSHNNIVSTFALVEEGQFVCFQVNYQNIMPGLQNNFNKRSLAIIDHLGTSYDYGSVMHYGKDYFSRNGRPTIVPHTQGVRIGQRDGFSSLDAERINKLYNCQNSQGGGVTQAPVRPPVATQRPRPGPGPETDDACYHPVPDSRYVLRVERGCYRVLKFRQAYIVTYCTAHGHGDFTKTFDVEEARSQVRASKRLGLRRCRGPGKVPPNRRRPVRPVAPPTTTGWGGRGFGGRGLGGITSMIRGWLGQFSPAQGDTPRHTHSDTQEGHEMDEDFEI